MLNNKKRDREKMENGEGKKVAEIKGQGKKYIFEHWVNQGKDGEMQILREP